MMCLDKKLSNYNGGEDVIWCNICYAKADRVYIINGEKMGICDKCFNELLETIFKEPPSD